MNLVDQTVDYNLQTRCKNAIQTFCHVDSEQDVLGCLRKHLLEPALETSCRLIVINRLMIQNKDARFNPSLWKACFKDVNLNCRNELAGIDLKDLNQALEGRLLTCLKKRFVNDKLSKQCSAEVEQVMREAANVDYRLDPLLADACLSEIERFCADESNDKKEDCLRLSFQKGRIDPNQSPRCFEVSCLVLSLDWIRSSISKCLFLSQITGSEKNNCGRSGWRVHWPWAFANMLNRFGSILQRNTTWSLTAWVSILFN